VAKLSYDPLKNYLFMNASELKEAIKSMPLKELALIVKTAFEEKAAANQSTPTSWQIDAFIGQLKAN